MSGQETRGRMQPSLGPRRRSFAGSSACQRAKPAKLEHVSSVLSTHKALCYADLHDAAEEPSYLLVALNELSSAQFAECEARSLQAVLGSIRFFEALFKQRQD